MEVLGIDIGGSGMKGALVNVTTGEMTTKRFRVPTPKSRKPQEMAKVIREIAEHFNYKGPIGCGFPSVVKHGICKSQGNLDPSWVNVNIHELFSETTGLPVTIINDADAAGYATMNYGIGKGKKGLVVMITIGTGLGSGMFLNGELIPNFELGQIPYKEHDKIEFWAANSAKEREDLSYKKWGKRFNTFLSLVEIITCPDLIILGGGSSKDFERYSECITIDTPVIASELKNQAGIIGAACAALHQAPKD